MFFYIHSPPLTKYEGSVTCRFSTFSILFWYHNFVFTSRSILFKVWNRNCFKFCHRTFNILTVCFPPPLMDRHRKGSVTYTISHTDQTSLRIRCILRSWFGGIPVVPVISSVLSAVYSGLPFQHCSFTTPLFIHNQCGQYRGVLGAVSIL